MTYLLHLFVEFLWQLSQNPMPYVETVLQANSAAFYWLVKFKKMTIFWDWTPCSLVDIDDILAKLTVSIIGIIQFGVHYRLTSIPWNKFFFS
jgi:hypothetical protein